MKRPEITKQLSELLEKHIDPHNDPRVYWAKEVTFDYATSNTVRVDYMLFKPINNSVSGIEKGDFSCYEIKSSVDDFHSKNGHNFIGDKNYYVMPESVFENVKNEIPYFVGALCPRQVFSGSSTYQLVVVKNAKKHDRTKSVSEMLLMMWRSSRREIVKARRIKKVEEVMETDVLIKNLREAANKWDRDNPNPPTFSTVYSAALRDAASRLEEYEKIISETQKPNNVLSIEDLQRMNGQPVWIEDIHEWAIVSVDENGYYEGTIVSGSSAASLYCKLLNEHHIVTKEIFNTKPSVLLKGIQNG